MIGESRDRAKHEVLAVAGAAAVCLLFALRALPGFLTHAADSLKPDHQDPLLNLVLLKWGAHQWRLGLPDFWNANFFFPSQGVMALSDHLLGPALALAALGACGIGPILADNLLLLVALAASPFSLCLLLRRCGASWGASLAAALGWGFAACRIAQVAHLQMLLALWIPPLLWSLDRLLERPGAARAAQFCVFYLLHLSGGSYLAYMAHVPLLAVVVVRRREVLAALRSPRPALALAGAATVGAGFAAAIYLPYSKLSAALGVARSPEEWRQFGAGWTSFLAAAPGTLLDFPVLKRFAVHEKMLFPGATTLLLALAALALARSDAQRILRTPIERALAIGSLACLALSFSPVFAAAARLLPGLDGLRVPARFAQLAGLGLALVAARGLDRLLAGWRPAARAAILAGVLAALAVELLPANVRWSALADEAEFPAVDHWLAASSAVGAYVDLPFPPRNRLTREGLAMYRSTLHWKPLVNGRSGYAPAAWWRAFEAIPVLPDAAATRLLRTMGVTHIVVREGAMLELPWRRERYIEWTRQFDAAGAEGLELVYRDATGDRVYRVVDGG